MASKTIEARLVISGEDRASSEIAKVVKAFKEAEKAAGFSDKVSALGKAYGDVERQMKATTAVMSARGPLEATVKNLSAAQRETARLAKEYDTARKAADDFAKAQRTAKTTDGVQQAAALSAEIRRLGAAHRTAENDARRLSSAFSAQTSTLRSAEAAASKLGADLSSLERHQAGLARQTDLATRALRAQIAADEAGAKAADARAARSANRREAVGTIVAGAGIIAAHKGKQIGLAAIESAAEMDYAVRQQHIATDVTIAKQKSLLLPQATRIGQETKFSNKDIVEAQTATMQSLPIKDVDVKAEVGAAIVDQVRNQAVILGAGMTETAETVRAFLQSTNKDISSKEKAVAEATRATNLMVRSAKLGGSSAEDVSQFIKFGVPTGKQSGFSDESMFALQAIMRRGGLRGDEAGTFLRSAASKLIAPTQKGREAEIVAGIDRSKYVTPGQEMSVENLAKFQKNRFGKDLSDDQRTRIASLLEDPDVVGKSDEFTKQVSEIVSESFDKTKGGKTKAQDASKIAKMVGDFYKMSVESTDVEGLLVAHLTNPRMTAALRNAFYTDKHGGKAGILATHGDDFGKDRQALVDVTKPENADYAGAKARYKADGLGGSIENLKGSWETLVLNIGTANENLIRFAAEGLAKGTDMFSNLSQTSQQVLSLVGGGAAVAGGVYGTAKLTGKLLGFGGGAVALNGSAVALNAAAAALTEAAVLQGAKAGAGTLPEVVKKGGKLLPLLAGGGALGGAGAIAYVLSEYGDASKSVNGTGGRPDGGLQMNAGDELPGLSGSTDKPSWVVPNAPSMTLAPGSMPLTIQGTGIGGFGLSGPVVPAQAGKEAGEKVGQGVADGIQAKTPEVEQQGRTLYQRIKELFAQGINMPINFTAGEGMGAGGGGGLIQKASLGGSSGGGGLTHRASLGSGGAGTGSGGGGSVGTASIAALPSSIAATDAERNTLGLIEKYESHGQNTMNYMGKRQGLGPETAKGYTAQGYFQMLNSNWRRIAPKLGITTPNAMASSREDQARVALHLLRNGGIGNWSRYNPALRGALARGERFQPSASAEPKLVKGVDGKEGLDLGNGTMKMPDGSIRSIAKSGLSIPEPPTGGFGGSGGGRGDMRAAAERMHQAADRMEGMGFHGQIQLAVTGSGRDSVRATGMRTRGRGGMSADLGVSMPGAKESDGDWV